MKIAYVILLFFIQLSIYSQEKESKNKAKEFWISAKIMPSFSRDLLGTYVQEVYYERSHRGVLSGGIELTKELHSDKLYIQTGLIIYNWGYKEKAWSTFISNYETNYTTVKARYWTIPLTLGLCHRSIYLAFGTNGSIIHNKVVLINEKKIFVNPISMNMIANSRQAYLLGFHGKAGYKIKITEKLTFTSELFALYAQSLDHYPRYFWPGVDFGYYSVGLGFSLDYVVK